MPTEHCPDCSTALQFLRSEVQVDIFDGKESVEYFHCPGCDQDWSSRELSRAAWYESEGSDYFGPFDEDNVPPL